MPAFKSLISCLLLAVLPFAVAAPEANIAFTAPDKVAVGKNLEFSYEITAIPNAPDAMLVAINLNAVKLSFEDGTKVSRDFETHPGKYDVTPGKHQGSVELAWPPLEPGNYTLQYSFQLDGLKGNPGPFTSHTEVRVPFAGSKLQPVSAVGAKETSVAMVLVAAALGVAVFVL